MKIDWLGKIYKVDWQEVSIFLLATSMMTMGTVAMAASQVQHGRSYAWWLLVVIFPTLSFFAGIRPWTRSAKEKAPGV